MGIQISLWWTRICMLCGGAVEGVKMQSTGHGSVRPEDEMQCGVYVSSSRTAWFASEKPSCFFSLPCQLAM